MLEKESEDLRNQLQIVEERHNEMMIATQKFELAEKDNNEKVTVLTANLTEKESELSSKAVTIEEL